MNQDIINKIQDRILKLIPANKRGATGILLKDSCSEVSRLAAHWIQEISSSSCISILKGVSVCGLQKSHDILAVLTSDGEIYVIDPTIWQFFPSSESVLIFISKDLQVALKKVKTIYGGQWSISEENIKISEDDKKNYLAIIEKNILENLESLD